MSQENENLVQIYPTIDGEVKPRVLDVSDEIAAFILRNAEVLFSLTQHSRECLEHHITQRLAPERSESFPSTIDFVVMDVENHDNVFARISLYVHIHEPWRRRERMIVDDYGNTFSVSSARFNVNWCACGAQDARQTKEFLRVLALAAQLCEDLTENFSYDSYSCFSTPERDKQREYERMQTAKRAEVKSFAMMKSKFMRANSRKIETLIPVNEVVFDESDRGMKIHYELNNHEFSAVIRGVYEDTIDVLIVRHT